MDLTIRENNLSILEIIKIDDLGQMPWELMGANISESRFLVNHIDWWEVVNYYERPFSDGTGGVFFGPRIQGEKWAKREEKQKKPRLPQAGRAAGQ
jgi:hypothetical protein